MLARKILMMSFGNFGHSIEYKKGLANAAKSFLFYI